MRVTWTKERKVLIVDVARGVQFPRGEFIVGLSRIFISFLRQLSVSRNLLHPPE